MTPYIASLLDQIDELEEKLRHTERERDEYFRQVKSYEMWQDRAIERVKEMQQ